MFNFNLSDAVSLAFSVWLAPSNLSPVTTPPGGQDSWEGPGVMDPIHITFAGDVNALIFEYAVPVIAINPPSAIGAFTSDSAGDSMAVVSGFDGPNKVRVIFDTDASGTTQVVVGANFAGVQSLTGAIQGQGIYTVPM